MTILSTARSMSYEVGSNLKGTGIGATWPLALPSLDVRDALVVGRISTADRSVIEGLADRVTLIDRATTKAPGSLGAAPLDLVVLGKGARDILPQIAELGGDVVARLASRGALVSEIRGAGPSQLAAPPANLASLTAIPVMGPARVLVPSSDIATINRLASLGFIPPRGSQGTGARTLNRLIAAFPIPSLARRRIEIVRGEGLSSTGPPAYVADIAAAGGRPIGDAPWAIVAPGDYASQKVLLLLFEGPQRDPSVIVKLGRDPAHAARLENEAATLVLLARLELPSGSVPELRFAGSHAGRGVVGQSWLAGKPFSASISPDSESPSLAAVTGWLTSLALATVERHAAPDVGAALRDLFVRFRSIHRLSPEEFGFLDAQVRIVEDHQGALPIVLQHGDPGTWNLLVSDSGRVAFLDWESAEPSGIPLWDLLHFQRAYGALAARRGGMRRRVDASLTHLVTTSDLNGRFARDLGDMAAAVELPRTLIEALFFTCWMHRALKEATRRTPASLERGFYLRLLRHLIRLRGSAGMRRLVASAP